MGLHGLRLGPEQEDGSREILASASDEKPVVRLSAPRGVAVEMNASVEVEGDDPLAAIKQDRPLHFVEGAADITPQNPQMAQTTVGKRDRFDPRIGGGSVREPREGERSLEFLTWNRRQWVEGSNISHAEEQFIDAFDLRVKKAMVKSITIHVNYSPCRICAPELVKFAQRAREARKDVKLSLTWDRPYQHPRFGTTQENIAALHGLWDDVPGGAEAAKAQEQLKASLLTLPKVRKRVKTP